jgi:hypothetical protein
VYSFRDSQFQGLQWSTDSRLIGVEAVHVDLMGFATAWGLFVMPPGVVVGVLVLIGGSFALFRSAPDSE